jgi:hypothetical protein
MWFVGFFHGISLTLSSVLPLVRGRKIWYGVDVD